MGLKRLSEFEDEQGVVIVAKLLPPIFEIAQNEENEKARSGSNINFVEAVLSNNSRAVIDIFAILSETDPAEYHCNAAEILVNAFKVFSDPPFMELFGLQGQTKASSGSASATTEAPEASKAS